MNDVKTLKICYLYKSLSFHKHDSRFKYKAEVNEKVDEEFSYIINQCQISSVTFTIK